MKITFLLEVLITIATGIPLAIIIISTNQTEILLTLASMNINVDGDSKLTKLNHIGQLQKVFG